MINTVRPMAVWQYYYSTWNHSNWNMIHIDSRIGECLLNTVYKSQGQPFRDHLNHTWTYNNNAIFRVRFCWWKWIQKSHLDKQKFKVQSIYFYCYGTEQWDFGPIWNIRIFPNNRRWKLGFQTPKFNVHTSCMGLLDWKIVIFQLIHFGHIQIQGSKSKISIDTISCMIIRRRDTKSVQS